ncbi:MAG: corrinoid protein [Anaerolineae bacterium]|jgi:trimethylamine corrinoid protein
MMANKSDLLAKLRLAIMEGDEEQARESAQECLDAGISPMETVESGLRDGLRRVGEQFELLEVFLPEMIMAAEAGNAVMEVLQPAIEASGQQATSPGTVIIGAAKGDIHTIGKSILAMLLRLAGFEVHDLGEAVAATTFLEKARSLKADIIAISALMTSTMPGQREVVNLLRDVGEREKYRVIVGGAPVTQEWADQIGADGYAETASAGVTLALRLMDS